MKLPQLSLDKQRCLVKRRDGVLHPDHVVLGLTGLWKGLQPRQFPQAQPLTVEKNLKIVRFKFR